MSAVQKLQNSKGNGLIVEKYVDMVLQESVEEIYRRQDRLSAGRVASKDDLLNKILEQRSYTINNGRLSMKHNVAQRFVDMNKNAELKVHDKIIWSEYSTIIRKLRYGFTEKIKAILADNIKIEING